MTTRHSRLVKSIAGATTVVVVAAACGGSGQAADTNGAIGGEIGYSYWGSPTRTAKIEEVVDIFESKHPGATISIEASEYQAYLERTTVRAAGRELPCATAMQDTFFWRYADADVLMPLDEFIESGDIDVSDINQRVVDTGKVDGQQYMIPTGSFVRVLAYNAAMLDEFGLEPPPADLDWVEYGQWLRTVQAGLPEGIYAGQNEGDLMFVLQSWILGHGETMYDQEGLGFPKEMLGEFLQFWLDLTRDGAVLPPDRLPEQYLSVAQTPLAAGNVVSATRDIPHIDLNEKALAALGKPSDLVGIPTPSPSPDVSSNVLGANGISIPASCANSATAAAFVDTFTNDVDAALAFGSDNGITTSVPAQDALLADPETDQGVKDSITLFRDLAAVDDFAPISHPPGATSLTTELRRLYESVAFGQMSVDDAVDAFFSTAEIVLN